MYTIDRVKADWIRNETGIAISTFLNAWNLTNYRTSELEDNTVRSESSAITISATAGGMIDNYPDYLKCSPLSNM